MTSPHHTRWKATGAIRVWESCFHSEKSPHSPRPRPQARGALTSGLGRRLALREPCRAATSLNSAKSKQTARCVSESLQA